MQKIQKCTGLEMYGQTQIEQVGRKNKRNTQLGKGEIQIVPKKVMKGKGKGFFFVCVCGGGGGGSGKDRNRVNQRKLCTS